MSQSFPRRVWALAAVALLAGLAASGGESQEKPKEEAPPQPATHTVKKGPFRIEVKLQGIFEAAEMAELSLEPEAWTQLQVVKAVEQGARVRKGDPVVWLDLEKIDEAIAKTEADQALSDLAFQQAEENLRFLEKTTPLDLAAAEEGKRRFDEDYQRYFAIDLPMSKKNTEMNLRSAEFGLMYAKEELRQLEKMYAADEITEETEEIVLKRARFAVERSLLNLENVQDRTEKALKTDIPRGEQDMRTKAEREAIGYAKAKVTLPAQLKQKQLEFEKLKRDRAEAADKLAKMKRDREAMTVKAPIDGIVYYGQCDRGHWPTGAAVAGVLRKGGGLKPQQIFVTIVQPRPLLARADVPEKELHLLAKGLDAQAVPTGYPDLKLAAELEALPIVPIKEGTFDGRLTVTAGKGADAVMPGMTCAITIVAYEKKDALTVPASAVFEEDGKQVVYVKGKDERPERRAVQVGRRNGGKAEILEGLSEGDTILTKKP